jgi:hypothetical protein
MGVLLSAGDCSTGWLSAVQHLLWCGGDCFNLVTEIENPTTEHAGVRRLVAQFLEAIGKKPIDEVANTIFPVSLYFPTMGRDSLYQNYETAWPQIKLFPANKSGTYFYRMIHWGDGEETINQLDNIIDKLRESRLGRLRYRNIYEVSIYRPECDRRNRMGFPCLSHLSFKLHDGRLCLTAVYRNQFYIERAYGNFIGLGRLMEFIARESESPIGPLTCVATHAELDYGKMAVGGLVDSCLGIPGIRLDQSVGSEKS